MYIMSIIYTFKDGSKISAIGNQTYNNPFPDASNNEVDTIFIEKNCALPAYDFFLGKKLAEYINVGTLFSKCINLQSITVEPGNDYYSSDINGCLYSDTKITLFAYPLGVHSRRHPFYTHRISTLQM